MSRASVQRRAAPRPRREAGLTLVEMLGVLLVVAVATGAVLMTSRAMRRTSAKAAAGKLAAAIRYTYDRSITTGAYYRIVFELSEEGTTYWAEKSDERFYLVRGKEKAGKHGVAPGDEEAERERRRLEEEERNQPQVSGTGVALQPPPRPKLARFEAFKDSHLPRVALKGVRVRDLYTPRQLEPYRAGKAFLYFFPDGHTERALIHLEDDDGDVFTLRVHPLSGRVEVRTGDEPLRREDDLDAEGRAEAPR